MNLLKLSVFALVSAISLVSLTNASYAEMPSVKKVDTKVQVVQSYPPVIPLITSENDPDDNEDYQEEVGEDYYSDDDNSQYYKEHPQNSHVETGKDSQGGHWGYHYDTDDTSEYDKDTEPHWGYHFDNDVKAGAPTDKHYGHHAN